MSKSIYDPISAALGLEPIHLDFKELLTSGTLSHKGELNPFYGYIHTHESRKKCLKPEYNVVALKAKKIQCLEKQYDRG